MKLYKRKDFLDLPENTIYSHCGDDFYQTIVGLYCKTSNSDTLPNDWMYQDLISEDEDPLGLRVGTDIIGHAKELRDNFQDFRMDLECNNRDGMFQESNTFVVWDKEDIKKLRDYLNKCL